MSETIDPLSALEEAIGHAFRDRSLLVRALTHSSYANEADPKAGVLDNETLEFLGDSVLGFLVAELLFRSRPDWGQGLLTKARAEFVSEAALADKAKKDIQAARTAIDEINATGGLLGGRRLELVIRDDEGEPPKGVKISRELVEREKVVAAFGGLHTTVALAEVPVWTELKTPYMGPWAAGTAIARNSQTPNYVFRVSANDDYADKFLVRYATETLINAAGAWARSAGVR